MHQHSIPFIDTAHTLHAEIHLLLSILVH